MLRIAKELADQGKTRADVARATGMHPSTVGQIVAGRMKPYPGQAAKIADALGWKGDIAELFEEVDPR